MISDLPEPLHEQLPGAPLELAVWQLQFAEPAPVQPPAVGTRVAEALAADDHGAFQLTRLTNQTLVAFGAGPFPGPAESGEPDGWQLRRGQLVVNLNRNAMSVETTAYEGWTQFRRTIELLCVALTDAIGELPGEQRLGLRYVDRITLPAVQRPADWKDLLAPWLAAVLTHDQLGDAVLATAGQVELRVDDDAQSTLRHRAFPDFERRGRQTVMLDFDTFRQGYRLFDTASIVEACDRFNDVINRLFEASITPDLRAVFQEASA
jgi:uncharacterized protein (TIGR04255 family)